MINHPTVSSIPGFALALTMFVASCVGVTDQQCAFAQNIQPEEFASLLGIQPSSSVQAVGYDSVDPVSIQLADLQSQISSQHMEIGQLRSQLKSPLDFQGRPASRYFASYESVLVQPVQANLSALIVETDDGYSQVMFPW